MFDRSLNRINERLNKTLTRDRLLQDVTSNLRQQLKVNRVVLYYFYREWKGQVVVESLSNSKSSILGSTGADDCFNGDYAQFYLDGRVAQVDDVEEAGYEECHLEFLRSIHVRANLVVPVIVHQRLWGLLIAQHNEVRSWTAGDRQAIVLQAEHLAEAPVLTEPANQRKSV
ncbi:GAF domain protein [[Leptolyngbya] sp. PCC 7376]|uniref:GAF domain-containing protein n=1 Tax=[Leptolyngbya] sp. PCC 7376 TaxID=111781 RepID=UPI00029EFD2D|nr:GAF domain-containing protein [[Leptolyngbya] sp. PCC 7376]AFY37734.1 GAF domain protein [[Leptolyngbya] sp. PCC 7376]